MLSELNEKLGVYLAMARMNLGTELVHKITCPISTEAMDAGFDFSTRTVNALRMHLTEKGIDVDHIYIFTAFSTNLKRKNHIFKSEAALYVVRNEEGRLNALYFAGCSIDDS